MKLFAWTWLLFSVFVKINAISNKASYKEHQEIRDKTYHYEVPNRKYLPSSHGIEHGGGGYGGGGYGLQGHGDFGHDYYGHGYDYQADISYEGDHDFNFHGHHHLQPIPQPPHYPNYPNPAHKKAVAFKSFLLPLAGAALIGAAALLATNPILLQLGVVSGKRRRRDVPSDGPYRAYVDRRRTRTTPKVKTI